MSRRWLWMIAAPAALLLVGATVYAMALRLTYPFDLEWMEGGQLSHAWRILNGKPLYPEPSVDWIPYIYPPGYSAVVAGLGSVVGLSAPLGRSVSWFGTALSMAGIVWCVGRQGRGPDRWLGGLAGAVVFLGCWSVSGAFLDLVRPDALALGLWLLAVAMGLEKSPKLQVLGGVLLAAAFVVKHPMAAWGLPLVIGLWARDGRPWAALRVGLGALVPAAAVTGWLQLSTGGTFLTYLLEVPASHSVVGLRMVPGTFWEWGTALPATGAVAVWVLARSMGRLSRSATLLLVGASVLAVAAGVGALWSPEPRGVNPTQVGAVIGVASAVLLAVAPLVAAVQGIRGRLDDRRWVLAVGLGLMGVVVAAWMRGHVGGYVNVLLPLYAVTAIGFGLMVAQMSRTTWGTALGALLLGGQAGWAWWTLDVDRLVPTAEDRLAGERIVELLAQEPGPVWSPAAPWLAVQAGHEPGPHIIAVWDTGNHKTGPWPTTRVRFEEAVAARHWGTIVDGQYPVGFGVDGRYTQTRTFVLGSRFRPRTGYQNRPVSLWSR